jgi:hypothetical protein
MPKVKVLPSCFSKPDASGTSAVYFPNEKQSRLSIVIGVSPRCIRAEEAADRMGWIPVVVDTAPASTRSVVPSGKIRNAASPRPV